MYFIHDPYGEHAHTAFVFHSFWIAEMNIPVWHDSLQQVDGGRVGESPPTPLDIAQLLIKIDTVNDMQTPCSVCCKFSAWITLCVCTFSPVLVICVRIKKVMEAIAQQISLQKSARVGATWRQNCKSSHLFCCSCGKLQLVVICKCLEIRDRGLKRPTKPKIKQTSSHFSHVVM